MFYQYKIFKKLFLIMQLAVEAKFYNFISLSYCNFPVFERGKEQSKIAKYCTNKFRYFPNSTCMMICRFQV